MTEGGQTGCLETTPCLFGDYALPTWRLRPGYMQPSWLTFLLPETIPCILLFFIH